MNQSIAWSRAICGVLAAMDETSGDDEEAIFGALMFIVLFTIDFPDMRVWGRSLEILRWNLEQEGKLSTSTGTSSEDCT